MTLPVNSLVLAMEEVAPTRHAEPWDRVGLLVGDPFAEMAGVLLCIDLTSAVVAEAVEKGCQAVVAYHPPIFKKAEAVVAGSPVYDAVRAGLSVFTPHTALDVAVGGTNDVLADAMYLTDRRPIRPGAATQTGLGRIGRFAEPVARDILFGRIKRELDVQHLLVAGPHDGDVQTVAACAGSCGDLLDDAARQGAELYLTGEMSHHDALRAARYGMTVVCVLHSNSERATLARLRGRLVDLLPEIDVQLSTADRDPFTIL